MESSNSKSSLQFAYYRFRSPIIISRRSGHLANTFSSHWNVHVPGAGVRRSGWSPWGSWTGGGSFSLFPYHFVNSLTPSSLYTSGHPSFSQFLSFLFPLSLFSSQFLSPSSPLYLSIHQRCSRLFSFSHLPFLPISPPFHLYLASLFHLSSLPPPLHPLCPSNR